MKNRRKEPRRKEENQVALSLSSGKPLPNGKKSIQVLTQDISTGGLRVLTDVPLAAQSRMVVRLVLSRTRKVLELEGQVRWVTPVYEDDLFEVGIEFRDISPSKALFLLKHVYGDTRSLDFE
jgi:c-di-GMP-binding flagellar brake protein YcgR